MQINCISITCIMYYISVSVTVYQCSFSAHEHLPKYSNKMLKIYIGRNQKFV